MLQQPDYCPNINLGPGVQILMKTAQPYVDCEVSTKYGAVHLAKYVNISLKLCNTDDQTLFHL